VLPANPQTKENIDPKISRKNPFYAFFSSNYLFFQSNFMIVIFILLLIDLILGLEN